MYSGSVRYVHTLWRIFHEYNVYICTEVRHEYQNEWLICLFVDVYYEYVFSLGRLKVNKIIK